MEMVGQPPPDPLSRQERRKAATRGRILEAANELFESRGYAETSIEEIAEAADVAVRTIYAHFASKAGVLLAYFDGWLQALVAGVRRHPVDRPIAEVVDLVLREMVAGGWVDRPYGKMTTVHPFVLDLLTGPPEIAGHVMHAWLRAQDEMVADALERGAGEVDLIRAQARATAVFAACMAPILAADEARTGEPLPAEVTGNGLVVEFLALLTRGGI